MKVMGLFSGIGGFELGMRRAGHDVVAVCETDVFCMSILKKRFPEAATRPDITRARFYRGQADIITAGFPCQDVSAAGNGTGLSGERSGLYREFMRAVRVVRPAHAIVENVAALVNRGLRDILGEMAEVWYDTEWDCVPACAVGLPHRRDRVWIVAHPQGGGWGTGRQRRPPDSFARVREQARKHDWKGVDVEAWAGQPALLGQDHGVPHHVDMVRAYGNALVPRIAELIGKTLS